MGGVCQIGPLAAWVEACVEGGGRREQEERRNARHRLFQNEDPTTVALEKKIEISLTKYPTLFIIG